MGPNGRGRRTPGTDPPLPEASVGDPAAAPDGGRCRSHHRPWRYGGRRRRRRRPARRPDLRGVPVAVLGPRFLGRLYRRISLAPDSFLLVAERTRGTAAASSPARPTWPACTGASCGTTASRPPGRAAGPLLTRLAAGARDPAARSSGGAGVGRGAELLAVAVDPAQQGRGWPDVAGRRLPRRGRRPGRRRRPRGGGGRQRRRRRPLPAGRLRDRRALRAPPGTESLLMQWDRPASGPASDTGRS